jgi:hypothetical protein
MEEPFSLLAESGLKNCNERELRSYRRFYQIYPQIRETVSPELGSQVSEEISTSWGTTFPELRIDAKTMIERLSYSHLAVIMEIEDLTKRAFYETECLKGAWSVRELRRQIASLLYERTGLWRDLHIQLKAKCFDNLLA